MTFLDAAGSAVAGLIGLLSCFSCTWPIVAAIAVSVLGATALNMSYDPSTAVFVLTAGLPYWRPGIR